jgi:outer membrane protein
MKKFILALAVVLSATCLQAQTKVGTIDADYILAQMPEISKVEDGLKTYNTELQAELETSIKKYEALVAAYQADSATYEEAEKTSKESAIMEVENEIKNFRQKASVLIQMRRNELTKPFYLKIDEAMNTVISAQGFTQIFNSNSNGLAFADPKFDITDAVLEKLGIIVK